MMRWVQYESENNLQERLSAQEIEEDSVGPETLMILSPATPDADEPLILFGVFHEELELFAKAND